MNSVVLQSLCLLVLASAPALAINCKGCTPLDTLSFDKLIKHFPVSLVKFDVAYPYGDKHDEFAKISEEAAELNDLFIGEVGIKDYGDKDNEELGDRFKILKEDYPAVMMFVQNKETGKTEEFKFVGEFSAGSLKNFVRQNAGIYMPLAGCLEQFDNFALAMLKTGVKAKREAVLADAEEALKTFDGDEKAKKRGDVYVKVIRKMIKDGDEFIKTETTRTNKMLEGKLAEQKKKELGEKLNVLKSFTRQDNKKDEL